MVFAIQVCDSQTSQAPLELKHDGKTYDESSGTTEQQTRSTRTLFFQDAEQANVAIPNFAEDATASVAVKKPARQEACRQEVCPSSSRPEHFLVSHPLNDAAYA